MQLGIHVSTFRTTHCFLLHGKRINDATNRVNFAHPSYLKALVHTKRAGRMWKHFLRNCNMGCVYRDVFCCPGWRRGHVHTECCCYWGEDAIIGKPAFWKKSFDWTDIWGLNSGKLYLHWLQNSAFDGVQLRWRSLWHEERGSSLNLYPGRCFDYNEEPQSSWKSGYCTNCRVLTSRRQKGILKATEQ